VHVAHVDLTRVVLFILFACDVLCITCMVLLIDDNMLHDSTLPYIILVSCIIFATRIVMCS
jgi:hypothetical protein